MSSRRERSKSRDRGGRKKKKGRSRSRDRSRKKKKKKKRSPGPPGPPEERQPAPAPPPRTPEQLEALRSAALASKVSAPAPAYPGYHGETGFVRPASRPPRAWSEHPSDTESASGRVRRGASMPGAIGRDGWGHNKRPDLFFS